MTDEHDVTEEGSRESANDQVQGSRNKTAAPDYLNPPDDGDPFDLDAEMNIKLSPEELPTLHWPDIEAELAAFELVEESGAPDNPAGHKDIPQTRPLGGIEEAMTWLEQLAAGQGMPVDEMPTLVTAQPVVGDDVHEDVKVGPQLETGPTHRLHMDSDPMAWLEQLAVDQSSPLEELPSVADRLLASEIASQIEIGPDSSINNPIDINQALSYLEKLAVAKGLDLAAVDYELNESTESLDEELSVVERVAVAGLAAFGTGVAHKTREREMSDTLTSAPNPNTLQELERDRWSDLSAEMPDDPEMALRWLSDIGVENSDKPFEVVTEPDTIGTAIETEFTREVDGAVVVDTGEELPENELLVSEPDTDVLEAMPDDPDEAVAWMRSLADSSGEPVIKGTEPQMVGYENLEDAELGGANQEKQNIVDDDELEKTIALYQAAVDDGAADEQLVEALEEMVDKQGATPQMLRLLGDAYMQTGQVEKAVATYRKGFDHL